MTSAIHRLKLSLTSVALALTLVMLAGVALVGNAIAASTAMVAKVAVNLRSGPGMTFDVIKVVPAGAAVTASGTTPNGRWTQVSYGSTAGWLWSEYVAKAAGQPEEPGTDEPEQTGQAGQVVTIAAVNVRTGPATTFTVVEQLPPRVTLQTTGTTSGVWVQVVFKGEQRWMHSALVSSDISNAPDPIITVKGQIRTTASLYLRAEGFITATIQGLLPANSIVDVTGEKTDEYTQISYQGKRSWIATRFTKPVENNPTPDPDNGTDNGGTDNGTDNGGGTDNGTQILTEDQRKIVAFALAQVGDDYVWGAEGPDAYDCSGLTLSAYKTVGIKLPHYSAAQAQLGRAVASKDLEPGDLIFWGSPIYHVSMYIGDGLMVHARNPRVGVVKQTVASYIGNSNGYVAIRRILP